MFKKPPPPTNPIALRRQHRIGGKVVKKEWEKKKQHTQIPVWKGEKRIGGRSGFSAMALTVNLLSGMVWSNEMVHSTVAFGTALPLNKDKLMCPRRSTLKRLTQNAK